jgi:hypothetical protein
MIRFLVFWVPVLLFAQPSNLVVQGVTAQQAIISYIAADENACTVAVTDPTGTTVHDVDTNLFANANLDSRIGSITNGRSRVVVIGHRASQKSSLTNHWYSLSLQAATTYTATVTCDGQNAVATFTTTNIPLGAGSYTENLPPDPNTTSYAYQNFGGWYAYPDFVNWTNDNGPGRQIAQAETVIDPQTGIALKRMTMPGDGALLNGEPTDFAPSLAIDLTGSRWSTANCAGLSITQCLAVDDANYVSYSNNSGPSDRLFLQDATIFSTLSNSNVSAAFDSLEFTIKAWAASGSGANAQLSVCLTGNRVNCWPTAALGVVNAIPLTNSQAQITTGSRTNYMLTDWMPAGYNLMSLYDIEPRNGVANVDGSGNVTWVSGYKFYRNWVAGSHITITSSDCTISSVTSPTMLAITLASCSPALTTGNNLNWSANNFGLLVWKTTTSTDQVNLQFAKWTSNITLNPRWPSGGHPAICSNKIVTRVSNGHTGFHCFTRYDGSSWAYFVDNVTGESVPLGKFGLCGSSECYSPPQVAEDAWSCHPYLTYTSVPVIDAGRPNNELYYASTLDNSGGGCGGGGALRGIILKCIMTSINEPGNFTTSCTNITPGSQSKDLQSLLASFNSGYYDYDPQRFSACGITSITNRYLIGGCSAKGGSQNSFVWNLVFDPNKVCSSPGCVGGGNPGAVIASFNTFQTAFQQRWSGSHGTVFVGFNATRLENVGYPLGGGGLAAVGPYRVTITAGHLGESGFDQACGSPSFPCSITVGGYPVTVLGYDNWTVDGEPCNPSPVPPEPVVNSITPACPKHSGWDYIGDSAVGDVMCVLNKAGSDCAEFVYINSKTDHTHWQVARGFGFLGVTDLSVNSNSIAQMSYGGTDYRYHNQTIGVTWDYLNDPHGQNLGGAYVIPFVNYSHETRHDNVGMGYIGDPNFVDALGTNIYLYGANFTDGLAWPNSFVASPNFAGKGAGASAYSEVCQPHIGYGQDAAPLSQQTYGIDVRPCSFIGNTLVGAATNVSGNLFKFTSTTIDGDNLTNIGGSGNSVGINRKFQATLAFAGNQPLIDISGPASVIDGTTAHNYQYCIARRARECFGGGAQGDIYVNWPYPYPFDNGTFGAGNGCSYADASCGIEVFNTGFNANNASEIGFIPGGKDPTGSRSRILTYFLGRHRLQNDQGNAHLLPDASFAVFYPGYGGIGGTVNETPYLLAKLPPYPDPDGVNRTTFVPIQLDITAPLTSSSTRSEPTPARTAQRTTSAVSTAVILFGYEENEPVGWTSPHFYCTSRQEACVAQSSTIDAANPFAFQTSDSPAGLACSTSCTITIPAISGRVLRYQVQYKNSLSQVVAETSVQVVAVP